MKRVLPVLCLFVCCHSSSAQQKTTPATKAQNAEAAKEAREYASPAGAKLPVRRVVLYKNGVGYFEHLGRVRGSQDVHVDFTGAQLNDARKSLHRPGSVRRPDHRRGLIGVFLKQGKANNVLEKMIEELQIEATI